MDVIKGVIIIACAMIMAEVVYSKPSTPKGPERENRIYTINPTTTGGKPINAFKIAIIACRNWKRVTTRNAAKGKAINVEIVKAVSVT